MTRLLLHNKTSQHNNNDNFLYFWAYGKYLLYIFNFHILNSLECRKVITRYGRDLNRDKVARKHVKEYSVKIRLRINVAN